MAWVTALETLRANPDAASADEAAGVEIEKNREDATISLWGN